MSRSWRFSVFGFHEDEHLDALMDLVERVAEGIVFVAGDWVFEAPRQLLAKSRKRLAFLGGLVTEGNDVVEVFTGELVDGFATQGAGVDGEVLKGGIGSRVYFARLGSCAESFEAHRVCVSEHCFGELGASSVCGANKQDADLASHHWILCVYGFSNIRFFVCVTTL